MERCTINKSHRHLFATRIIYEYLVSLYQSSKHRIVVNWPYTSGVGERKADLAVITFPQLDTEVWVEIQDTPLGRKEWENKLKIECRFKKLLLVLTERTIKDLKIVLSTLKKSGIDFEIMYLDIENERLFKLCNGKFKMVRSRKLKSKRFVTLAEFFS